MSEILIVMLTGSLFSADDFLGMPPKERNATLIQAAPADALIYAEWAERSAGVAGGKGVDGLIADPEVKHFVATLKSAIRMAIDREMENAPPEAQTLGKHVPDLILTLIDRPGCVFINFDPEKVKVDPSFGPPTFAMLAPAFSGGLVIHGGSESDSFAEHIMGLLSLLPAEIRSDGQSLERQMLPIPIPATQVMVHRHGDYFILAVGEPTLDAIIAGLDGDRPGMETNERFARALQEIDFERTGSVGWVDIRGLLNRAAQAMGPLGAFVTKTAEQVGADSIDAFVTSAGVIDGQIVSRSFLMTDGSLDGILALAAGRAIQKEDFAVIPADADLAVAFSISFPKILAATRTIVGQTDPGLLQQLDAVIAQLEAELGLSLEDDILAGIDDVWTVYDSPSAGGVLITSLVASLHIKDAEAANRTMTQLMKVLKAVFPEPTRARRGNRGVFLSQTEFLGRTIHFVNTVGDDVPFAPSFCTTDREILVAIHPQALKAHLRFLDEKLPVHPGPSLEDGELIAYSAYDNASALRYLYALSPYIGQLILSQTQREGFPMDASAIPSARAILPYVSPAESQVVRTENGFKLTGRRSVPVPGLSSLLSQGPAMMFMGMPWFMFARSVQQLGEAPPAVAPVARPAAVAAPARAVRVIRKDAAPLKKVAK